MCLLCAVPVIADEYALQHEIKQNTLQVSRVAVTAERQNHAKSPSLSSCLPRVEAHRLIPIQTASRVILRQSFLSTTPLTLHAG